jgi:hypothetical protein
MQSIEELDYTSGLDGFFIIRAAGYLSKDLFVDSCSCTCIYPCLGSQSRLLKASQPG